jgi:NAD-dependent dihydropyrimidine dehydrogenase PreA subunit
MILQMLYKCLSCQYDQLKDGECKSCIASLPMYNALMHHLATTDPGTPFVYRPDTNR